MIWDNPEKSGWQKLLDANNKWDVLILQAGYDNEDNVPAVKFVTEAYKSNPACEAMIYTNPKGGWSNPVKARVEDHSEQVAAALKKAFPDRQEPRVIPSSMLVDVLAQMADAGLLPGVPNRSAITLDGKHLSKVNLYAINVLVCAMLYRESPLSYPDSIDIKNASTHLEIPAETVRTIRQIVWDILLTYKPAGMATRLVLADRHLKPALAGQPYEAKLSALNASKPITWSITAGKLPEGLSLSPGGVISGKTAQIGMFPVTIKLTDANDSCEQILSLYVSEDRPPVIQNVNLKPVALDAYTSQEFKADGGVGSLKWDITDGKLPFGMRLVPTGILAGTPGEAGEFIFTIRATDSHPTSPKSVTQVVTWKIGSASTQTMLIRPVIMPPRTYGKGALKYFNPDGLLDETHWKLEQPIMRNVAGKPTAKAVFDIVWLGRQAQKETDVSDLCIAIKVTHGPKGKTPKDAVHIFIDGMHNQDDIHNLDNTYIVIPRKGSPIFKRCLTPRWRQNLEMKVRETDDGYIVEIRFGKSFFTGKGITVPFSTKAVYGFDIAVEEGDKTISRQTWCGDDKIDEDTSSFGSILLIEKTK